MSPYLRKQHNIVREQWSLYINGKRKFSEGELKKLLRKAQKYNLNLVKLRKAT
jgi:hypothetical protein